MCKDGNRFAAVVSITALGGDYDELIGYLLIGADNSARKQFEAELLYRQIEQHNQILERTVLERTAELRTSEERIHRLTELSSGWYWEQDASGKYTVMSGPALEMLRLGGKTCWHESGRADLEANIAARRPFLDLVYSRTRLDGSLQHLQVSGEPFFSKTGRYIGYRGIGMDVTQPRREH